ncbi:Transcription factor GATA-5 [Actinomortierella ambigua]|nr:Transcription factor GATA-5 [Actinomortierella ambigua]
MSKNHLATLDHDVRDPTHVDHQGSSDADALSSNQHDPESSVRHQNESKRLSDDLQSPTLPPVVSSRLSDSSLNAGVRTQVPVVSKEESAEGTPCSRHEGGPTAVASDEPAPTSARFRGSKDDASRLEPVYSAAMRESLGRESSHTASLKQGVDAHAHPPDDVSATTSSPPDIKTLKPDGQSEDIQHAEEDAGGQLQPPFWSPTPPTDDCNFLVDYDNMEAAQQPQGQHFQFVGSAGGVGHSIASSSAAVNKLSLLALEANGGNNNNSMLPRISLPLPPPSTLYSTSSQQGSSLIAPTNWHPLALSAHHQDPSSSISPSLANHRTIVLPVPYSQLQHEQLYPRQHPQAEYFDSLSAQLPQVPSQSRPISKDQVPSVAASSQGNTVHFPHAQAHNLLAHASAMRAPLEQPSETTMKMDQAGGRGRATIASYGHRKGTTMTGHYSAAAGSTLGYFSPPVGPGSGYSRCSCAAVSCSASSTDATTRGSNALVPPMTDGTLADSAVVRYGPWSAPSTPSGVSHPNLYHRPPQELPMPQVLIPHSMASVLAPYGTDGSIDGSGAAAHRYYSQYNEPDYRSMRTSGDNSDGIPSSSRNQSQLYNSGSTDYTGYGIDNPMVYGGRTSFHSSMVSSFHPRAASAQTHHSNSSTAGSHGLSAQPAACQNLDSADAISIYTRSRPRYTIDDGSYRDPEPKHCTNCMTMNTPSWRRCPEGRRLLCNACGLFEKLHGRPRPTYQAKDGSIKIQRTTLPHDPCIRCDRRDSPQWFRTANKELISKQQRALMGASNIQSSRSTTSPSAGTKQQLQGGESKPNRLVSNKRKRKSASSTSVPGGLGAGTAAQATMIVPPSMRLPSASSLLPPTAALLMAPPEMGLVPGSNRDVAWPSSMYRNSSGTSIGTTYEQPYPYALPSTNALAYSNAAAAAAAAAAAYAYQAHYPYLPNPMTTTVRSTPPGSIVESASLMGWQGAGTGGTLPPSLSARLQNPASEFAVYSSPMHPSSCAPMTNITGSNPIATASHLGMMRANVANANAMVSGFPSSSSLSSSASQTTLGGSTAMSASGLLPHDDGISPSAVEGSTGPVATHGPDGQLEGNSDTAAIPTGPSMPTAFSSSFTTATQSTGTQSMATGGPSAHSETRIKSEDSWKDSHTLAPTRSSKSNKRKISSHDEALSSSSMTSTLMAGRSQHEVKRTRINHDSAMAAAQQAAAARSDRYRKTSSSARAAAIPLYIPGKQQQQHPLPKQHAPPLSSSHDGRQSTHHIAGRASLPAGAPPNKKRSKGKYDDEGSEDLRAEGDHGRKRRRGGQPTGSSTSGKTTLSLPAALAAALDAGNVHHRKSTSGSSVTSRSSSKSSGSFSSGSSSMEGDEDDADDEDEEEDDEKNSARYTSQSRRPASPKHRHRDPLPHNPHHAMSTSSGDCQDRKLPPVRSNKAQMGTVMLRIPKEAIGSSLGSTSSLEPSIAGKPNRSKK